MSFHITSRNYCKYSYTLVEEPWLQSECRICGCFLAGYIHIHTAVTNLGFGLQCQSVHWPCYSCIGVEVTSKKTREVSLWCLFLWTNYKPIDMVTFLYSITHKCNSGGCWSAWGTDTVIWLQSDSFIYRHFLECRSKRPFVDSDLKTGCGLSHC
jgi:hypothetical protein